LPLVSPPVQVAEPVAREGHIAPGGQQERGDLGASCLGVGERPLAREGLPGPLPALEVVAGQQVQQAAAASQARRVALERAVARRVAEQRVRQAAVASQARQAAPERADTSGMRVAPMPEGQVGSPAREVRALGARPGPEGRQ
jgi:hypothetical protein